MSSSEAARRGPIRLTTDGRVKADPVFLRGGAEIVFTVLESPQQLCLMRLTLADGKVERLHPGATTSEFEAAFSADGHAYAFVQSRGNLNLKLVIRNTQLGREAAFDPGGGFAGLRRPTLTPDGSRVVFSLPNATGQQLVAVDGEGKGRRELTQVGFNNWPTFSPDGKGLAFGSSRDGDFDLYVMNADGSDVRRLTQSPGLEVRPAWSPDGRRLAFTSNRTGCYQVHVVNAEGGEARCVRRTGEREDYPCWHPDGKRLVVVSEVEGRADLYLIDVPA